MQKTSNKEATYNQKLFQAVLAKMGVQVPYQIWLTTPEISDFILIDENSEGIGDSPEQLLYVKESFFQHIQDNKTTIYFRYPENYQIVVCIYQSLSMEEEDFQLIYHLLYPCYADFALRASKFKIDKIIESIRQTTATLDLEELFSTILSNTMEVIPNADLGSLWIYDSDSERLICKTFIGNLLHGVEKMRFTIGEGIVGYCFRKGEPILFSNVDEFAKYEVSALSPENAQLWDPTYDFFKNVKSLITAPIIVDDQVECVMILCQIKTKTSLTSKDLQLLQGFTSQVGIAMRNAKLFTNLKSQNELLIKRDDIHATLTELSLQNMGANKVIRELARMIGLPLLFIDLIENESIPETRKLPNQQSYLELYEYVSKINEQSLYDIVEFENSTRYLYPIRTGNVILGCLVIEAKRPLNQLDQIALEQGHSILALELVKKQNLVEFYYKKKRELFQEILQTTNENQILQKARELGIKETGVFTAAKFQFSYSAEPQVLEAQVHRLITQLKHEFSPWFQTVFGNHNEVTLLISIRSATQFTSFCKKLGQLLDKWNKTEGVMLSAGIGSIYEGVQSIVKTYNEAENALSYLVSRQISGYIEYAKIGVNRLFIHQRQEEIQRFLLEVFEPLRTTQGLNNSLEQTLVTYFECNRSAVQTAKRMHVHINTLYQRLKKIEDCLQISLDNPENVLRLQLACYLKETFGIQDS
ncbi:helix-turn-helix domain-containing protein [Bacillus rubiinfantis]|uniref:helix-turn-helix domain-containing protein n=1 Tax=Bacillus rubiinfantis TaxID=1499680 RepID=UPI0005A9C96F|nr:helix-turn-helix domain-containing protein [Bacillus rubiinfantis]